MLESFLSATDADRASRTLGKLAWHNTAGWALTGGLAVEVHHLRLRRHTSFRPLNDIDFIVDSFEAIPDSLASDFIFRHIHPFDPSGKTLLQMVDLETAVRVDVFRTVSTLLSRKSELAFPFATFRLIALEDLLARTARLTLDLAEGNPMPAKHAHDFLRLLKLSEFISLAQVEEVWPDHRKPKHPATFAAAARLLTQLIAAHPEVLVVPAYSRNPGEICSRCASTSTLRLADPKLVMAALGYC